MKVKSTLWRVLHFPPAALFTALYLSYVPACLAPYSAKCCGVLDDISASFHWTKQPSQASGFFLVWFVVVLSPSSLPHFCRGYLLHNCHQKGICFMLLRFRAWHPSTAGLQGTGTGAEMHLHPPLSSVAHWFSLSTCKHSLKLTMFLKRCKSDYYLTKKKIQKSINIKHWTSSDSAPVPSNHYLERKSFICYRWF